MSTTKSIFVKDFSGRLNSLMTERGLTQQGLADAITVSQTSVSAWLRGQQPSRRGLKTLADYFKVNVDWLLKGEGSREFAPGMIRETPVLHYRATPKEAKGEMLLTFTEPEIVGLLKKYVAQIADSDGPEKMMLAENILALARELREQLCEKGHR